jgi:DNA-binding CsgD family transcriptional regulator
MRDMFYFSGYALYLVFSYISFHSATLLSSGGGIGHHFEVLFLAATLGARICVYFVIAAMGSRFEKLTTTALVCVTVSLAICGLLVTGMVFQFSSELSAEKVLPWLLGGSVLLGSGDALVVMLWARFSATLTLRSVYLYVVLCNMASLAIYWAATLLPTELAVGLAAVLFGATAFCSKRALDVRPPFTWEYSKPVFWGSLRRLSHPIVGTSILCFMAGLMLQISGQQEIPLSSFQQVSLASSAVVVLFLLLPPLLVKRPLRIGRMYAVALPLSAAGFLLLPLIWNAAGGIVNSFAQLGSMLASIILWCMLAAAAHDTKLPSSLLFAIALICPNAAQLAGTLMGYLNADTLRQSDLVLTAVALVAAYLLFMVALFLFKDKSLKGEEDLGNGLGGSLEHFAQRCAAIAETHHFTPREADIFVLLAHGFTIPFISEKLFVSENTVKSHVKSIYQKLGIHVRSELIELVSKS